ncbi:MAG: ACP S-malonyltransferase [Proteobacteria bacterium]|uniref:ACP S-malonyltransferase n=1 Tax=Rudaea sp. TaxID=2136325 RepID=UPI001D841258|nr:ACP S-malonyltransferase [Pseudomonadota bacterium]MBS0566609.1 ACP S-malonyltransferase [Pseudomonadota bacterium]
MNESTAPADQLPSNSPAKSAFVFPGQGSQSLNMLSDLAGEFSIVEETFKEASSRVGLDLWVLAQEGPQDALNRTENTQPALLAAGVAVWRVWRQLGGALPDVLAGHSLGEYTALVCAEALPLAEAAALVAERGRLMQAAVPPGVGAMAAVLGGDDAQIAQVCAEVAQDQIVAPANFNAPGQLVIAGHAEAVDRALARLAELGVKKAVKLAVSVPSHCMLMRGAADKLAERFDTLAWQTPRIPVVQNADAKSFNDLADIRAALSRQLYQPVRWTESVQALAGAGVKRAAECGPGKVLTGLFKRIDRTLDVRAIGAPADLQQAIADWKS